MKRSRHPGWGDVDVPERPDPSWGGPPSKSLPGSVQGGSHGDRIPAERNSKISLLVPSPSVLQMRKFLEGKGLSCGHRAHKGFGLRRGLQDSPGQGFHEHLCRNRSASTKQALECALSQAQGCPCSTAFTGSQGSTKPMPSSLPWCVRPFSALPSGPRRLFQPPFQQLPRHVLCLVRLWASAALQLPQPHPQSLPSPLRLPQTFNLYSILIFIPT